MGTCKRRGCSPCQTRKTWEKYENWNEKCKSLYTLSNTTWRNIPSLTCPGWRNSIFQEVIYSSLCYNDTHPIFSKCKLLLTKTRFFASLLLSKEAFCESNERAWGRTPSPTQSERGIALFRFFNLLIRVTSSMLKTKKAVKTVFVKMQCRYVLGCQKCGSVTTRLFESMEFL